MTTRPSACRRAISTVVIAATIVLAVPAAAHAQRLVYLVRHAERADGGATTSSMAGAPADPALSAAGEARAKKLAAMLADSGVKAIYATEFRRTKDTGAPLAARLGIQVRSNPTMMPESLLARLKTEHAKDIVLVVGHSNTLPGLIKALGGPDVSIPDTEYDSLYVVVPATGTMTRIRY